MSERGLDVQLSSGSRSPIDRSTTSEQGQLSVAQPAANGSPAALTGWATGNCRGRGMGAGWLVTFVIIGANCTSSAANGPQRPCGCLALLHALAHGSAQIRDSLGLSLIE
ncbi:hypothetical protein MPTK1_4g22120 [Marchantia polymorpha subsp. ruderalis]|uniref:Uncharacterized protein n=2 Tax=Marchantia polymorpha TaxID=3197 RepID=A0AAF6BCI4_MARPO|nr:hypothetical protein MARPO_0090s0018 [Marchantia polymorpha]BBN09718.1 hypothetical protein Mp_4g22120 [Marchantia polymorpha subsp. ruderalis]|eukprot:PTQ33272.1 hypothetical protein MARPO_0090s0018 [Marchantia polymorpha]